MEPQGPLNPLTFIQVVSFLAIVGAPLALLREKWPKETNLIAAGGAIMVAKMVMLFTLPNDIYWNIPWDVFVAATFGLVFYGLIQICDQAFEIKGRLPPLLSMVKTFDRGAFIGPGIVGALGVLYAAAGFFGGRSMGHMMFGVSGGLGVAALCVAWGYSKLKYQPMTWVLERRPEAVCWIYVLQTKHYRNGVYQGTTWTTIAALDNRESVTRSSTQQECEALAAQLAMVCPRAALGYSDATRAQYDKDPTSVRKPEGAAPG